MTVNDTVRDLVRRKARHGIKKTLYENAFQRFFYLFNVAFTYFLIFKRILRFLVLNYEHTFLLTRFVGEHWC